MDAPREVKAAIFLSLTVVVIETVDRLWRISMDSHATTTCRDALLGLACRSLRAKAAHGPIR